MADATMPSLAEAMGWIGADVAAVDGARVGQVQGFYVDTDSGEPAWLIARLGRRRNTRVVAVPMSGCAGAPFGVWVAHRGEALRGAATSPVALGIVLGLVVGKLLGVLGGTWLALQLPSSSFVSGTSWGQVTGVASVAGIGFTIALFVTDLAFEDPLLQQEAKIGILVGSALAAALALAVFRYLSARGGLCLPDAQLRSLPPLSAIPDPE